MQTNKPEVVLPEAPPIPAHLFDKDQSIVWYAAWETLRKHMADTLTPPPAIDIGKLRELVARLKSMAAGERERAKHYSVPVRDAQAMHGLARILDEIVGELAALIGDGGVKGNG